MELDLVAGARLTPFGLFILGQFLTVVEPAAVVGVVRDRGRGTALSGASAALVDLGRVAVTDSAGRYRLDSVPTGRHRLTVRRLGYRAWTLDVLVAPGGPVEIHVLLEAEPHRLAPLEVSARRRDLRPSRAADAEAERSISGEGFAAGPRLAEPDPLIALEGRGVVLDPEVPQGVNIDGGFADQTGFLLDGIPIFNPYHGGGVFAAWNPDALARIDLNHNDRLGVSPLAALSGVVNGVTRRSIGQLRFAGGASTNQGRLAVDGPLWRGAGFLVSARATSPTLFAPDEASYLQGGGRDLLVSAHAPALGGEVSALFWDNGNESEAAAVSATSGGDPNRARHGFEWLGRSWGLQWIRTRGETSLRVAAWSALGTADAIWAGTDGTQQLTNRREDVGLIASATTKTFGGTANLSAAVEHVATDYRLGQQWRQATAEPRATLGAGYRWSAGSSVILGFRGRLTLGRGPARLAPELELGWHPTPRFETRLIASRRYQFAQSLRNPESLAGTLFPADLFVGAGDGIPVGRSDQATITATFRPTLALQAFARGYLRNLDGIVLVSATETGPFAVAMPRVGRGSAYGASLGAERNGARFDLDAGYDWHQVRYQAGGSNFVPGHGASHRIRAGVNARLTPSWRVGLGVAGIFGRRGTASIGGLEWEPCNLADRGCEFAGNPLLSESVGSRRLPGYFRVDLSARKEWTVRVGGRQSTLGAFGTVTNLLGRVNLQTMLIDPRSGDLSGLPLRSRVPLVVGLDWHP